MRLIRFNIFGILLTFFLILQEVFAAEQITITRLKNQFIETVLVAGSKARSVIVCPIDRYSDVVEHLREEMQKQSGVVIPVYTDDVEPSDILSEYNVISLGNMSTNSFIEKLYRQWYVILDLKYPGPGGYTARSLHNPYGTGNNVVFLGGSDDLGVREAAEAFLQEVRPGDPLMIGWLMKIKLSPSFALPKIKANMPEWQVHSWQDSWRQSITGQATGYPPATFFGWNPISVAGILYYMTGEEEYLKCFKELATPKANLPSQINRKSEAFSDPIDPIVNSDHYRAHLLDLIWDLIEESPLLTDEERLFVTNKLIKHQLVLDPSSTFYKSHGDRHELYHMLSIYTGSRYLSTYYPDPIWTRRLDNVRTGFRSLLNNPTWAVRDTLEWVSTSIEPVFDFFLMDGADDFVESGTALTYMRGLEALRTGEQIDDFNRFLSINLLFKASFLLNDNRYVWMAQQLGTDSNAFRIGQSYWPATTEAEPPMDLVGKVCVVHLARRDRETSKTSVSTSEAFQLLSFRSGLQASDDFLLLDGFEGLGRHPYQVNTLSRLRMFGGKSILAGYANDLNTWHNGLTDARVARSAALKQQVTRKAIAYIHTEVPDMPGSTWQRRVIYRKDSWTMVLDQVTAKRSGRFDIVGSWEAGSNIKAVGKPVCRVELGNGTGIMSADIPLERVSASIVQAKVSRELEADESISLATLFFDIASPNAITASKQGGYLLSGRQPTFMHLGPYRSSELIISADFVCIDRGLLLLAGATEMTFQGDAVFRSDRPVTILWDLKAASVTVSALETARIQLASSGQSIDTVVQPGERVIASVAPVEDLPGGIDTVLVAMEKELSNPEKEEAKSAKPLPDWQPTWEIALSGKVTAIAKPDTLVNGNRWFWAVSQQAGTSIITRIGTEGKLLDSVKQEGEILSFWPAKGKNQSRAFDLLAGFKDDMLRAFSREGKEIWGVKAAIHPSFLIGHHYDAPWFTDPRPPHSMTGVYSILAGDFWGIGREEIAIGRPCTVEFYDLNGRMNAQVPTRWGNNTALALLRKSGVYKNSPVLLAGKAYTGSPQLSGINHAYANIGDNLFGEIAPEFTNMHAWLQRGLSGLRVADIDNNGSEEVILTLSGNWNELRVYDANGKIQWMQFFGPDKKGSPFMTVLETTDLTGDSRKEVVVGTKRGYLTAFSYAGKVYWQRHFDSGVTCLSVNDEKRQLAVGCDNGSLVLLDADGHQRALGIMAGAVRAVVFEGASVLAGTDKGQVRHYLVPQ
jgi:hypothetical protein